jgi:hypothetical protein
MSKDEIENIFIKILLEDTQNEETIFYLLQMYSQFVDKQWKLPMDTYSLSEDGTVPKLPVRGRQLRVISGRCSCKGRVGVNSWMWRREKLNCLSYTF